MRREIKEETGLDVQEIRYLFSSPNVYEYSGMGIHTLDMDFLVHVHGDPEALKTIVLAADDAAEALWIPISEINPVVDEQGAITLRARLSRAQGLFYGMNVEVLLGVNK